MFRVFSSANQSHCRVQYLTDILTCGSSLKLYNFKRLFTFVWWHLYTYKNNLLSVVMHKKSAYAFFIFLG